MILPTTDCCDDCGARPFDRSCKACGLKLCRAHHDCPECETAEGLIPAPSGGRTTSYKSECHVSGLLALVKACQL